MTRSKIEIANSNDMKSRFSCEVKNSLIFHQTEIIVLLIHIRKMRPSFRTDKNLVPVGPLY